MVIPYGILTCDVALFWFNPRSMNNKEKITQTKKLILVLVHELVTYRSRLH